MKKTEIYSGTAGLNAPQLLLKANTIYSAMLSNSNFPHAAPFVSILLANKTTLQTVIDAGGTHPTVEQTAFINSACTEVKRVLKAMVACINYDGNSNEAILLTSGFDLKTAITNKPHVFNIVQGSLSGSFDATSPAYKDAAYNWKLSPDPIGTFTSALITSVSKATISGLTAGVKYWCVVEVTQGSKVVYVSDPHFIIVV